MSKSEGTSKPQTKVSNGLLVKMILKLYKESVGGKVIMMSLENDFKLPLIIAENTEHNHLLEIINSIHLKDNRKDNFEKYVVRKRLFEK